MRKAGDGMHHCLGKYRAKGLSVCSTMCKDVEAIQKNGQLRLICIMLQKMNVSQAKLLGLEPVQ